MIVNTCALGRDPNYWNEVGEFLPERFDEECSSIDFKGNNMEYIYIPFGAGRRMVPWDVVGAGKSGVSASYASLPIRLYALDISKHVYGL